MSSPSSCLRIYISKELIKNKYLDLDMPKIDPQLLQQWRFALVPLSSKRRQPACPQSTLLAHPPAHSAMSKRGGTPCSDAKSGTIGGVGGGCGAGVGDVAVAVLGL